MASITRSSSIMASDIWHVIPEDFRPPGCVNGYYYNSKEARKIEYTFCCSEPAKTFMNQLATWSLDNIIPEFILSTTAPNYYELTLHFSQKEHCPLQISRAIGNLLTTNKMKS